MPATFLSSRQHAKNRVEWCGPVSACSKTVCASVQVCKWRYRSKQPKRATALRQQTAAVPQRKIKPTESKAHISDHRCRKPEEQDALNPNPSSRPGTRRPDAAAQQRCISSIVVLDKKRSTFLVKILQRRSKSQPSRLLFSDQTITQHSSTAAVQQTAVRETEREEERENRCLCCGCMYDRYSCTITMMTH